jgi:hypothetical protein
MAKQHNPSVWQEIHCPISGGGCGGFILVKLTACLNRRITLVCPKCGHRHERCIKDGLVVEEGRMNGVAQEELCPTIAAWSEQPRTVCMRAVVTERNFRGERTGTAIKSKKDLIPTPYDTAELILRESWAERNLGKVGC